MPAPAPITAPASGPPTIAPRSPPLLPKSTALPNPSAAPPKAPCFNFFPSLPLKASWTNLGIRPSRLSPSSPILPKMKSWNFSDLLAKPKAVPITAPPKGPPTSIPIKDPPESIPVAAPIPAPMTALGEASFIYFDTFFGSNKALFFSLSSSVPNRAFDQPFNPSEKTPMILFFTSPKVALTEPKIEESSAAIVSPLEFLYSLPVIM